MKTGNYIFMNSTGGSGAAGSFYAEDAYRMVEKGVCYETIYFIHSTNIGNYQPGTIREYDTEALSRLFNGVLATLVVK